MKNQGSYSLTARVIAVLSAIVLILLSCGCSKGNSDSSAEKSGKEKTSAADGDSGSAGAAESFETVKFGSYEQDNDTSDGKEKIEWLVLEKNGGKALVVSKYALDSKQYNDTSEDVTWETCTLRKWLNEDFLNEAFTPDEQSKIQTVNVTADKNPNYDISAGNDTSDKVFVLSTAQAQKYFTSVEARRCAPTDYAVDKGVIRSNEFKTTDGSASCWWWLRTPGYMSKYAMEV